MLVLTKLEITIMYCYETVILPSLDVTSPNVMLSTQCLPAYSLVLGGDRNRVYSNTVIQPGTRNSIACMENLNYLFNRKW